MTAHESHRAIDAVWRIESAKIIAKLARMVRDVGLAEELAQDALVTALERWPQSGVPDNPGAWLMAVAKHRAIDNLRRRKLLERKHEELGYELELEQEMALSDMETAADADPDDFGDDLLRLIFTACHPVLSTEARIALTLRLLGGLTTDEIARAFLVSEPTVAQRIVRAKRTLSEARVPFEVPREDQRAARLASVLEVLYLVFNEGYAATSGGDWMRPALCDEALRLGRILAELAPQEPEVHGLVALMEIQASRAKARIGPSGEPVLLLDQNRARWDHLLIRRGLAALGRAGALGGALWARTRCRPPSPPAMRGRLRARKPTGRASRRCTTHWPSWRRRRWSSSTVRWRWRWPSVRPPAWRWPMPCCRSPCSRTTTCCPACAATFSPSSAGSTKRVRSSSARPRSRGTCVNASCCWSAPPRVNADRDRRCRPEATDSSVRWRSDPRRLPSGSGL